MTYFVIGADGVVVNLYDYHLQGSCSSPLPGELRTPVTLAFGQPSRIGIKLGTPNGRKRWSNGKYFIPVALSGNKVFHLKLVSHIKYNYFTLLYFTKSI